MIGIDLKQSRKHSVQEWHTDDSSAVKGESGLDVLGEIHALLGKLGESRIEPVAYDTAWIARLSEHDATLAANALTWLRSHQLLDGAWGALEPLYHHDRVVCTLAAIIALQRNGVPEDQVRIRAAFPALHYSLANLHRDMAGKTVGFEMILPSLVAEARSLGLMINDPDGIVQSMADLRSRKLERAPKGLISRDSTMGFSAEMAGPDGLHLLDVEHLQQDDGSICVSPAATAFFVNYVRSDPAALAYLHRITHEGGAATITAIEVFERAWGLWDLKHARVVDKATTEAAQPLLNALAAGWHPGVGIAMNDTFLVQDGDHTGIVCELLANAGHTPDLSAVLRYEEDMHFRCYALEHDASISTNIHILGALRQTGFAPDHPAVRKIFAFLEREQQDEKFWFDKWHSSPYYASSLAIITCVGYHNELVETAVEWLIDSQNADGSWGYYLPSSEETAYSLKALLTWHQQGLSVPMQVLTRGAAWLAQHTQPPYTPLWISKCLYCPTSVVQSAIFSALRQYECEFGALP